MNRSFILILLSISIIIGIPGLSYSQGQYLEINDIKMYYEIHGKGAPLLLLHGGLGSIEYESNQISAFKLNFQVIAPEHRGHARTTDSKQPITYELITSDIVKLLDHLNLDSVNVVGFSDGAIIGLHLAISYPQKVKKLIVVGANFKTDGLEENFISDIKNFTPENMWPEIIEHYKKLAPEPDHWPIFFEKMKTMWLSSPNFSTDMLANINAPTLVLTGDRDGFIRLDHTIQLFQSIPNSQLCLIPGATHMVSLEKPELLNQIIINFLQATVPKQ